MDVSIEAGDMFQKQLSHNEKIGGTCTHCTREGPNARTVSNTDSHVEFTMPTAMIAGGS